MTKRTRTRVDLPETARRLANHREMWRRLVDFDSINRYDARIASSPDHEAWLLTWLSGQGTEWHDHGESAGSFVVLCQEGYASSLAAASLQDLGIQRATDVVGGYAGWTGSGGPA